VSVAASLCCHFTFGTFRFLWAFGVVVLVENGGFGGQVAAPVVKAVYEGAFAAR
jgi:hypothetical protein